jgi:hypothetical protein
MTQLHWTTSAMIAGGAVLSGAAWMIYTEGFTWFRAALVIMALLALGNHFWRQRTPRKSPVRP